MRIHQHCNGDHVPDAERLAVTARHADSVAVEVVAVTE